MSKNIITKSKVLTKFRVTFRQALAFLTLTRVESGEKQGYRGNVHIPIEK